MPHLLKLPTELLLLVISHLDRESLRQARLTCWALADAATTKLFRATHLFPNDPSCESLENILDSELLRQNIQKIYFRTCERHACARDFESDYIEVTADEDFPITLSPRFVALVKRLKEFPSLRGVAIWFDLDCFVDLPDRAGVEYPQSVEFRMNALDVVFSSLVKLPTPIQELGIQNLQNVHIEERSLREKLNQLLSTLRSLRLNVVGERDANDSTRNLNFPEQHEFFARLPSEWFGPATSNLQNLTLYADNFFGFYPKLDLSGVHFPQLQSFSLANYSFAHDSQLEWILSHGDTLRELYLNDCVILYEIRARTAKQHLYLIPLSEMRDITTPLSDTSEASTHAYTYTQRWSDYFAKMQERLPRLKYIGFGTGGFHTACELPFEQEDDIKIGMFNPRYAVFDDGQPDMYRISLQFSGTVWTRWGPNDQIALEELIRHIGQPLPKSMREKE